MKPLAVDLDTALEDRLFETLERDGIACIENAVNPEFLARLRAGVDGLLDEKGERYFSIIRPQEELGGAFAEMVAMPEFEHLMRNLARRGHSDKVAAGAKIYNVLRIIAGQDAAKTAFEFHYDATVVTVVMPLYIPEGPPDKAGDLVALVNRRRYRWSSLVNIIEKAVVQNPLAFRWYAHKYGDGKTAVRKLKPGNLYLFWGYRTFHANLPCEPGAKRATLLFHLGDPHEGSALVKTVLNIRKWREARRLAKT